MNPTITKEGDIARNNLREFRQNINFGASPKEARATVRQINAGPLNNKITTNQPSITPIQSPTNIDTTIPNVIPAKALSGNVSYNDLRLKRNNLEQQGIANQADTQRHNDLLGRANSPLTGSPITNPDAYINELLLNRPTKTQIELDTLGTEQASQTRGFASELTSAQEKASKQFGVGEAQTALGETQSRIADRTVKLRQALRDFETNAEQRGVAREFVQSAKGKLQADAAAELADLSIIENAQLGNLQQAQAEVDRVIENKKQSFLYENQAIQQEIDNLNKKDDRESKLKATQLQIALDTRKQNIETQLANEKEQRGYLAEAAANGADTATLDAIRNAQSPAEAAFIAGPFIGRLERQQAQASLANTYSQIDSRQLNDTISLAEKGDVKAIKKLGFDPRSTTGNFEAESNLRKEFNALPTVKEAVSVQQSYKSINTALQEALSTKERGGSPAAADQALIISFNKMLDPASVVREGEFARSTQGQAYLSQIQAKIDAALRGGAGLTDQMRQEIVNTTNVLYGDYVKTHNDAAFEYRQNAKRQKGDPKYVAGYIDTTTPPDQAQDGDIIVVNGIPVQKTGEQFIPLDI